MREHRIAAIPGDGIGQEVIPAGLVVLEALARGCGDFRLSVETFPWGADYYRANGRMMPVEGLDTLKKFDAIYFGSAGDPRIPDHVTLWGLRLAICQGFDQYANVRPSRILPGIASPLRDVSAGDLDWVIVRENSEGEYAGHGGRSHVGLAEEVATEVSIFTRAGVERIMRFAFRAGEVATAQDADGGDEIECAAARHGVVGRSSGGNGTGVPGCNDGQDAGGRGDDAHGG